MGVPRSLWVLAGVTTAFGAALWMGGIAPLAASWGGLTIAHAIATAASGALAMLVTVAGVLLGADWRADVLGRQAWIGVNVAAAELSLPGSPVACGDLDPRYLRAVDNETLRRIFEAHRLAPPARMLDSAERASPSTAAASQVDLTGEPAQTARAVAGTMAAAATRIMGRRKVTDARRAAVQARLVVNGNAWWGRPGGECILSPTAPERHTADVIVLGSRPDDEARPLPEASVGGDIASSTKPPSCRGPPQRERRSCAVSVAPAKLSPERAPLVPGAGKWPAADPIVRDDLGNQVRVCAAELDVIETYLDQVLRELLASSTAGSEQEQS